MMESNEKPVPVPAAHVVVSSHPPMGTYVVIAELSAESVPGENVLQFKKRFQEKGAELGADYVMITGGMDNTYLAPAVSDTYSTGNASATAYANADGSVSAYGTGTDDATTYTMPAHTYIKTTLVAQALKMTSGSNQPNMQAPSNLQKYPPR